MLTPDIVATTLTSAQSIEILKLIISNFLVLSATILSGLFMIILAVFLVKAMLKLDLSKLFVGEGTKEVSSTKFWSNIAYFVATVAFLGLNISAPGSASIEWIWIIYLGVVASSSIVSKLIAVRWGQGSDKSTETEREAG